MFVVRPRGIKSTPFAVAHDLGCQTRFYPNTKHPRIFNYNTDFLMTPVRPDQVSGWSSAYLPTYNFATRSKYGQRITLLKEGIPAPRAAGCQTTAVGLSGEKFVVRPLRHSGGRNYRVTTDRFDFGDGEYISEFYPKRREYRIIFVFGKPVIYMRKKPHEGTEQDAPWGHVNSTFQTINDVAGSKIGQTDAASKLSAFGPVAGAHIVAADILYNAEAKYPWVCLELNFCPGLDIDNNRAKVVQCVKDRANAN